MHAALEIETVTDQQAFNLKRWEEICADPLLLKLDQRIETDRFGNLLMMPPPSFPHGEKLSEIAFLLRQRLGNYVATECPISTTEGIRSADVVWISGARRIRALIAMCQLRPQKFASKSFHRVIPPQKWNIKSTSISRQGPRKSGSAIHPATWFSTPKPAPISRRCQICVQISQPKFEAPAIREPPEFRWSNWAGELNLFSETRKFHAGISFS
jgi:hypothetical protein